MEIRNSRITRNQAIEILSIYGEQKPTEDIKKLCKFLEIKESDFYEIIEKFRNQKIWFKDNNIWKVKDFLIEDWKWQ